MDQNPNRKEDFKIACQKVIEAEKTLKNPVERRKYDACLKPPEFEADDANEEPFHWQNYQPNDNRQVWWETKVCSKKFNRMRSSFNFADKISFFSVEGLLFARFWTHNSFIRGSARNAWIEFNEPNLPLQMGFVSIIWNVIVLVFVYIFLKKKVIIFFLFGDRTYSIRRRTLSKVLNEHIPYYVKKNFKSQLNEYYNGTLGKLEKEVKHAFKKRWNIA